MHAPVFSSPAKIGELTFVARGIVGQAFHWKLDVLYLKQGILHELVIKLVEFRVVCFARGAGKSQDNQCYNQVKYA
jgi:hypothetical protein